MNTAEKQQRIQTDLDKEMYMLNSKNDKTSLSRFQFMP